MEAVSLLLLLAVILMTFVGLYVLFGSVVIVSPKHKVVVERMGRFSRTLDEGVHFVMPFIESCRHVRWTRHIQDTSGRTFYHRETGYQICVYEQIFDFAPLECSTIDMTPVTVDLLVFFQIVDVKKAIYNIDDLYHAYQKLITTAIIEVCRTSSFDYIRKEKNSILLQAIQEKTNDIKEKWGIETLRVEIQDVIPDKAVKDSLMKLIESKRQADVDKITKMCEAETSKMVQLCEANTRAELAIMDAECKARQAEIERKIATENAKNQITNEIARMKALIEAGGRMDKVIANVLYSDTIKRMAESGKVMIPYDSDLVLGRPWLNKHHPQSSNNAHDSLGFTSL